MKGVHPDTPAVEGDSYACWFTLEEGFHAVYEDGDMIRAVFKATTSRAALAWGLCNVA